MSGAPAPASPLFLREAEVRRGIELLFFGHASLFRSVEGRLAEMGIGRAHHRAMHFVARSPDLTVGALIALLGVTKQSLGRVIGDLTTRGLIETRVGRDDRRQRLLRLTPAGAALQAELFEALRAAMAAAYGAAGAEAVGGYWRVMDGLLPPELRARIARG